MGPYPGSIEPTGKALTAAECLPTFYIRIFTEHHILWPMRRRPACPRLLDDGRLRERDRRRDDGRPRLRLKAIIFFSSDYTLGSTHRNTTRTQA